MFSCGCFSLCKIGFVISLVRHSKCKILLISIICYPKVFLFTNSSSWICWSSAWRSRKSGIQATLVTTSSKQPFVSRLTCSPRQLTIIITMITSADTRQPPFDKEKARPEYPKNQHQDSWNAQTRKIYISKLSTRKVITNHQEPQNDQPGGSLETATSADK